MARMEKDRNLKKLGNLTFSKLSSTNEQKKRSCFVFPLTESFNIFLKRKDDWEYLVIFSAQFRPTRHDITPLILTNSHSPDWSPYIFLKKKLRDKLIRCLLTFVTSRLKCIANFIRLYVYVSHESTHNVHITNSRWPEFSDWKSLCCAWYSSYMYMLR